MVRGTLRLRYPDGGDTIIDGGPGPAVALEIRSWQSLRRVMMNPNLAFGEAIMDGSIVPVGCSVYDVLDMLFTSRQLGTWKPFLKLHATLSHSTRRFVQFNPVYRARRNVAHHYDLNGELYALLLDQDRQY